MDATAPSGRRPPVVAFIVAQVLILVPLVAPIAGSGWLSGFRQWAYPDQLSYAAIASNIAGGDFSLVEPFTQTGTITYPSGWYLLMGAIGFVTRLPVHLLWTIMGLAMVSATVLATGWACWRMSHRSWAPVLPALGLLSGILSGVLLGQWYVELLNHAVLWGPMASLFTLNGEIVGVCIVALALTAVMLTLPSNGGRVRPRVIVAAAGALGLVANIQTYSFFSGLVLATTFAAAYSLIEAPSRRRFWTTVGLVFAALLTGPWLADHVGRLPVVVIVVVALAVGAAPLLRGHARWTLLTVAAFALAASPQLIRTAIGLAEGDPFLSYRTVSSAGLGVAIPTGLVAASIFILAGLACACALLGRSEPAKSAMVIALAVGMALMSQNDRWGFNQEPYRFWIVFVILAALLLTPVLAWALTQLPGLHGWRGLLGRAVAVVMGGLWVVSLLDTAGLMYTVHAGGVIPMSDDQSRALRRVSDVDTDGLMLGSACMEPQVFKNIVARPTAHYNRGLAWPDNVANLEPFLTRELRAGDSLSQVQQAGITLVVTDSACAQEWAVTDAPGVTEVRRDTYRGPDGSPVTVTLWRVPAATQP